MKIISEYNKRPTCWVKTGDVWRKESVHVPAGMKMVQAIVSGKTQHILVPR